jgi:hypothetical protein
MMLDVKHCAGCSEDFYNGHNPYGVKECWRRKTATLGEYRLIHIDQAPPYLNIKSQILPNCYIMTRHAKVKPEALDAKGYWK